MNKRCFIIEPTNKDTSTADRFGDIEVLFRRGTKASVFTDEYRDEMIDAFRAVKFDPARDYFVTVGHQLSLLIAATVLQEMFGQFQALVFYPPENKYIAVWIGAHERV